MVSSIIIGMIKVGDFVRFSNEYLRKCHEWRYRSKFRSKNWFRRKNPIMRVTGIVHEKTSWLRGKYVWQRWVEVDEVVKDGLDSSVVDVRHLRFVRRLPSADSRASNQANGLP